jgi:hypothetical protein
MSSLALIMHLNYKCRYIISYTICLFGRPTGILKFVCGRFQDGSLREEAESVFLKVKSWRDAIDTPYRKNYREEAKL